MKRKSTQKTGDYSLAHVLYQKLGKDWYAFTEVDGDCFMTKVDGEVVNSVDERTLALAQDEKNPRKRRAA